MDRQEVREMFFTRRTDKAIISKQFVDTHNGARLRIASHILDGSEGLECALVKDQIVLRRTPQERYEIKATFLEDDRSIRVLTIQRFARTGPLQKQSFSLVGDEIEMLLKFVAGIRTILLEHEGKVHVSDDALAEIVLNEAQARKLFAKNEALFTEIATSEDLQRDLIAVGYRRKQLERFEALLSDTAFFENERRALGTTPEGVWQKFFETNTWIFGYGLSFQFLSSLDTRKLEQVVRGADVTGTGKRADALMKTRGLINSLCFVEVKRHDTPLLASETRPGVWMPSRDLSGGIAQVQGTVQDAIEQIGRKLMPYDDVGDPTGEVLFNIQPRSCLIIGTLGQFETDRGINDAKFRSFELHRRNMVRPEILTFDELLERARFIVNHGVDSQIEIMDDEVPF